MPQKHDQEDESLGDRLRRLRLNQGLSHNALAREARVAARTIIRIEQGRVIPRDKTVSALAGALGVEKGVVMYEAGRPADRIERIEKMLVRALEILEGPETISDLFEESREPGDVRDEQRRSRIPPSAQNQG